MKKLILIFSLCCFAVGNLVAQCTNSSSFGSATVNTSGSVVTISTCSFAGEYSTISGAVAGQSLKFTSSAANETVTIHSGTPTGPVLGFGTMPFTLANTFSGTIYAHWNTPGCGSQGTCRTTTVQCVSCIVPPVDPCANILSAACGVNQTVTLAGAGGNWSPGSCGFSTPGAEQVYTFTAPFTGIYTLNVTGGSGGFVDWFFKSTSAGCSATGWTCILDISGSGSPSFNLTAGTYYILADGEGTTSRTQTWNISCVAPADPCNSILPAAACGVSQTVTLSGTGGNWSPGSCGFSTPGAEQVYTFTAPTTGNYIFNVSNGSGGFVDWFYKSTSAGCGPNSWTCIDDISTSGTVTFALTAGDYFILGDAEGTTSRTQTWSIACPQPAPANDDCANAISVSCGQTVSGNTQFANPDVAPSCNGFAVGIGGGVWYEFVGNGGFVTLSTCDAGTDYDTKLHVYDGTCTALNCVTANDDDENCLTGPGTAGFKSTVTFCTVSGTTYYILVNGFDDETGNYAMSVDCTPPVITIAPVDPLCETEGAVTLSASLSGGVFSGPGVSGNEFDPGVAGPGVHTITYTLCSVSATTTITVFATPANDLVANAEPLACGSSVVGNTTCATSESLGTCGTTDGSGGGVWYAMVGNGNSITLTTCNSVTDFDTKLRVFTGSPSSLTCLGGIDDDPNCTTGPGTAGFKSTFTFCSTPGEVYFILVHGFLDAVGNFQLESSCAPVNPTITCAAPISDNLDANCSFQLPDYTGLVSANDDCGVASLTQSPAAGATVTGAGVHTITFTATDAGGNTATCSIDLTLTDVTAPNAVCQSVIVNLDGSGNAAVTAAQINDGSSDACGIASIAIDNGSFSCANTGNNTVTLTVIDVNGLSATCSAVVTVVDNQAPVLNCNSNVVLSSTSGVCGAAYSFTNSVSDNCPGYTVAQTTGLVSGTIFPVGVTTNTFVATDASGNSAACSFTVTVNDAQAPTAVCRNVTVNLNASGQGSTTTAAVNNGSSDACGVATLSLSNSNFTCANVAGPNTVVLTVTDVNGNTSTCSASVTVRDLVAPTAICRNVTIQVGSSGTASATAAQVNNGSNDACGIASVSVSAHSYNCTGVGPHTVVLTVTDVNGNSSTCSSTVTVVTAPVVVTVTSPVNSCGYNVSSCCNNSNGGGGSGSGSGSGHGHNSNCRVGNNVGGAETNVGNTSCNNGHNHSSCCHGNCNHSHNSHFCNYSHGNCGNNNSCGRDGAASAAVSGGCGPYTYRWSTGASSSSISGLAAGTYTVTVTDGNGVITVRTITLTQAAPLAVTATRVNVSCYGSRNGSATAAPTGGCASYTYSWSNGARTQSISNLAPGTYCVTVQDGYGCRANACVTVTQPARLNADAGAHQVVYPAYGPRACATLTGSASGGTPAYTTRWTNRQGATLANGNAVTVCPTATTVYYFRVTDSKGCTAIDSVAVCPRDISCGSGRVQVCERAYNHGCYTYTTRCVQTSQVAGILNSGGSLGACNSSFNCNFPTRNTGNSSCKNCPASGENGDGVTTDVAELSMKAYPNPTSGELTLDIVCRYCNNEGMYTVKVSDIYGKTYFTKEVAVALGEGSVKLDMSQFSAGVYSVTIENGDLRIVEKIVKQ